MSASQEQIRVYKRRPKRPGGGEAGGENRDWASLPPGLLEKVFESLEVADLQSAKETCRKWREQVGVAAGDDAPPMSSWTHTIESILSNLHRLDQVEEVDIEQMKHFLVREGFMKAPDN